GMSEDNSRTPNRRRRWRRKVFSTRRLRYRQRDDRCPSCRLIVVSVRSGRPDASSVTLNDAARERKCEAEAAALVIECGRRALVRTLYIAVFGDDDDRGGLPAIAAAPAIGDDRAGPSFLSQNRAENRIERAPKPRRISDPRRATISSHLEAD